MPITLATIKLVAAMSVNNTDLFFSGTRGVPDEEFLGMVQEGINEWARMVISRGGTSR